MNAPTYPDADHSAVARLTISRIPAAPLLAVIDLIGPANVCAADFGPSALTMSVTCLVIVADPLGIGSTAQDVWNYGKWPILIVLVITIFSVLYYAAPNVKLRGFKWVTPGVVLALVVWLIASAAFAFYVANFGSYDKTYGTLGGLVVLLVWMWITNVSLLLGMELNAERERARELAAGDTRADKEIQLEPRSEPKDLKTT